MNFSQTEDEVSDSESESEFDDDVKDQNYEPSDESEECQSDEYESDEYSIQNINEKSKGSTKPSQAKVAPKLAIKQKERNTISDSYIFDGSNIEDGSNDQEIVVNIPRSRKTKEGKRIYDKVQYCLYCQGEVGNIGRHLRSCKKADKSVIKPLLDPDTSKTEKDKLYLELRGRGNFYHNIKVLKTGGDLVVWRRPSVDEIVNVKDYIPCKYCLSFLLQSDMWKHVKSCPLKHEEAREKDLVIEAKCLLYPNRFSGGASKELQIMILQTMYKDLISKVAHGDHLITTYGSFMLNTSGIKRANEISQRMRILSRLLIKIRELKSEESLSLTDCIDPSMFDMIISCTQDLGVFSYETVDGENVSAFKLPSLPLKIGYSLDKCSQLLKGISIKNGDSSLKMRATDFSDLFAMEWKARISTVALRTLDDSKFNRVTLLPITDDLMKVRSYIKGQIPKLTAALHESKCLDDWRSLAEVIGVRLSIFNRRRGNEVYQMLVTKFKDRNQRKDAEIKEIKDNLTPLEIRLMESLEIVYVRGKRGRKVPTIMNIEEVYAIQALNLYRDVVGVNKSNPFVLAAPTKNSKKSLRGNACMAKVLAKIEGLESPERIHSTELRKFCATVSQIADLSENDLGWLANHLGHGLSVHKEYYRLRDSTVELSKVSRILLAIDEGNASKFMGKKLSEITIEELPPVIPLEDVDDESLDEDIVQQGDKAEAEVNSSSNSTSVNSSSNSTSFNSLPGSSPKTQKTVKGQKLKWSKEEIKIVTEGFHDFIISPEDDLPGKHLCNLLIQDNPILQRRTWSKVKDFVRNYKKNLKKLK
ncbi:uncharacterized protein [Clytia hemisphaerica]